MVARERFTGEIASTGTTSGDRIVVGHWAASPFGAFTDVMWETADGVRTLYAPSAVVAEYVAATYVFDEVRVVPIAATRTDRLLAVESTDWQLSLTIGRRTMLGRLLRMLPNRLATAPWWCALVDPVARRLVRGVSTRGSAGGGRREWYGAVDQRAIDRVIARIDGRDLGGIADVDPPVRFGFSSAPRRPSIVAITTTIDTGGTRRRRPTRR
jgi:hypothetical protein